MDDTYNENGTCLTTISVVMFLNSQPEQTNKCEEGLKGLGTCRKLRDVDYGCSETVKLQGIQNELEMTSLAVHK
ncbi:hypothetical protein IGI04_000671 [Brassica rapa subsp. trilocularis]|uniref:Uncharacterized protein n=1 Tax=Brassica rapa subsp. trilocularis TaxID=1813537 RepID=A0ABQ7NQG0_BRACM|nr:hypothetical protein IGI04_000671 [Brassica rapa subsp. trilocularis]